MGQVTENFGSMLLILVHGVVVIEREMISNGTLFILLSEVRSKLQAERPFKHYIMK